MPVFAKESKTYTLPTFEEEKILSDLQSLNAGGKGFLPLFTNDPQALPLLPKKYIPAWPENINGMQRMIDQITVDILSNSAYSVPICTAVETIKFFYPKWNSEGRTRFFFEISDPAMVVAQNICKNTKANIKLNTSARQELIRPEIYNNARKNWFVFSDEDTAITSFTTPQNEMIFIMHPDELNYLDLSGRMIHEMGIFLDSKNIHHKEQWEKIFPQVQFAPGTNKCEVMKALYRGTISKSLAAMRAFILEKEILTDLKKKYPQIPEFNPSKELTSAEFCQKRLEELHSFYTPELAKLLNNMTPNLHFIGLVPVKSFYGNTGCQESEVTHLGDFSEDLAFELDTIKNTKVTIKSQTMSLCQFMAAPNIGPLFKNIQNGPRPRMGGGWGGGDRKR